MVCWWCESFPVAQLMSRVDLCDGVAGGDAPIDDVNCGDVCCDGGVVGRLVFLAGQTSPTVLYLN
jgi:hypothetical protein